MTNKEYFYYFSDKAKEIAPSIEGLLVGLTIAEAHLLVLTVIRKIKEETKIVSNEASQLP